jgi:hypothetical protein
MRVLVVLLLICLSVPAWAQQSTLNDRLAVHLGNFLIQITAQQLQIEQLQTALALAQAHIKELEAKEPPK